MKENIVAALESALKTLKIDHPVELTPSKGHADFASNIAFKLAKQLHKSPITVAKLLVEAIDPQAYQIERVEVAASGFINFFLENATLNLVLNKVDANYGRLSQTAKIIVEFVSANPTGFLHLGHARGAALGDTLSNILSFAGNQVYRECYVNDAGSQIDTLGEAVFIRYLQQLGQNKPMPENTYRGQDIVVGAKLLVQKYGAKFAHKKYVEVAKIFKDESRELFLKMMQEHLALFNVRFDHYFSELSLYQNDKIGAVIHNLNHTYRKDGALWLETTKFKDDKDRVLIKKDGSYTYFAPDIAYHRTKFERGFTKYINILGADHAGYVLRQTIGAHEVGIPTDQFEIILVQLVKLIKNHQELKMSKRLGTSFTLIELIEMVGAEAVRFYMVNRSNNSNLDFNVDVATEKSANNPVYYIQYAHARANQILNKSSVVLKLGPLDASHEINLLNLLIEFPRLIARITHNYKVNLLAQYLIDLAREFHSYYNSTKIIGSQKEPQQLLLIKSVKQVLKNGLELMGITALERM